MIRVAVLVVSVSPAVADEMPPLTVVPGDPAAGLSIVLDRERGHCLLCHAISSVDEPFQGDLGPPLDGVGDALTVGQLRLRVADPTLANPDAAMPAFYRTDALRNVAAAYLGRPVLTAQEVEDVVAFLTTLRSTR